MPCPVTIGRHYRQKKGPCMQQIAAAAALPGAETMWVVTILFVLTYVLIVTDRINRSIIAMLGAGAMVVSGDLSQDEAIRGIDFNTIALLTGMMVLVAIARRCGMFEYVAVWAAKKGRAQPWAMLATPEARARVMALDERGMITDLPLMRTSLFVIGGVIAAFVAAGPLGLQPGTIALFGAAVLMLFHNFEHHREKEKQTLRVTETFAEVDWITIFFFLGLFVIVHGVDAAGLLSLAAQQLIALTGHDPTATAMAILWGSAILSAIVDNIPFVAAMIPLIRELAPHLGGPEELMPLWWAVSLGACLGGNGTLIGASANLTVAGIAERNGVPFGFLTYTKHAFGLMLISVGISTLYLWWRYL